MATLSETAAIKRRLPRRTIAGESNSLFNSTAPVSGPEGLGQSPINFPGVGTRPINPVGMEAGPPINPPAVSGPPTPALPDPGLGMNFGPVVDPMSLAGPGLATDSGVNAAYQALLQYMATADTSKGDLHRQLLSNRDRAANDRVKNLMAANQSLSDRGLLNSGIALGRQADIGTAYDTYDNDLTAAYLSDIGAIDKNITGLQTGYDNSQIVASGNYTAAQAKAAADAITASTAAAQRDKEIADIMAALAPPSVETTIGSPTAYSPLPPKPKPVPKPVPVSGTTGKLVQKRYGGPQ